MNFIQCLLKLGSVESVVSFVLSIALTSRNVVLARHIPISLPSIGL